MPQHMTTQHDDWSDALHDVLDRQQALADRLAALSEQQQTLIEAGRTDELLSLLGQRQQIVDQFLGMQDRFTELTSEFAQRLDALDPAQRSDLRARINAISGQLDSIMKSDKTDQQRLESARGKVKGDIEKIGASRRAGSAYGGPSKTNARYADERG